MAVFTEYFPERRVPNRAAAVTLKFFTPFCCRKLICYTVKSDIIGGLYYCNRQNIRTCQIDATANCYFARSFNHVLIQCIDYFNGLISLLPYYLFKYKHLSPYCSLPLKILSTLQLSALSNGTFVQRTIRFQYICNCLLYKSFAFETIKLFADIHYTLAPANPKSMEQKFSF